MGTSGDYSDGENVAV